MNFQRRYIVGARLAQASVNKTSTSLGLRRAADSKVTMASINHWRTSSAMRNCGREHKLNERDRHTLVRIVSKIIEHQQKLRHN